MTKSSQLAASRGMAAMRISVSKWATAVGDVVKRTVAITRVFKKTTATVTG